MLNVKKIKEKVLELCSESEYGSWEFWSGKDKTDEEMELIYQAIMDLIQEKHIRALQQRPDKSFEEVPLNAERLKDELKQSMTPYNVEPDRFYWFEATELGK